MTKIPIVFAFNDKYALPASIAIRSLLDSKNTNTYYEIFVFYKELKSLTIKKMSKIANINWIKIDNSYFKEAPVTSFWSVETYYRLIVCNILPQYDKIIWSDVDVLFKFDMSDFYHSDITDYDWGGVIAEKNDGYNGIHARFKENTNDYIYMPGLMLINCKRMRDENFVNRFYEVITTFNIRLKMQDLDVLNISCNKMKSFPFNYCVLENIYDSKNISDAPEYVWLSQVYSDTELLDAKQRPYIIHYAGGEKKIWNRAKNNIPKYYWEEMKKSPFFFSDIFYPRLLHKIINVFKKVEAKK